MITCRTGETFSRFACPPRRQRDVRATAVRNFPVQCQAPKPISGVRVVQEAGVQNALILVGGVDAFMPNMDYNLVLSENVINPGSFNFPAYLLVKAGDLHTLDVTTANLQNHPVTRFLRHTFDGIDAGDLFELAPDDILAETQTNHCIPPRKPVVNVIHPASLQGRSYVTIRVDYYQCGQFITEEFWYIIPIIRMDTQTLRGADLINWVDDTRHAVSRVIIPCESNDRGELVIPEPPRNRCGHRGHGNGFNMIHSAWA